jgi:hypothetical protein
MVGLKLVAQIAEAAKAWGLLGVTVTTGAGGHRPRTRRWPV